MARLPSIPLIASASAPVPAVPADRPAPLASPDGKRVAYVRGGARKGPVVVQHLESATSVDVEAPARSEVLVTDWSSDGRRLLFCCEYQAWLPAGELVVTCDAGSILARARGSAVEPIAKGHTRFSQAHVGENGAVAVIADDAVLLLSAGDYKERIGPRGSFADYQFPKPSPSGRRVGYVHHVRSGGGHVRVDLEVDGRKVADDVYDFEWLDEGTVVVLRSKADPSVVRLM